MNSDLAKARDAQVKEILSYHACADGDCPHASHMECLAALIGAGFDACLAHLQAQAPAFDEKAAIESAVRGLYLNERDRELLESDKRLTIDRLSFVNGSRWQHEQMSARVAAAESHADEATNRERDIAELLIKSEARVAFLETFRKECEELRGRDCIDSRILKDRDERIKELEAEVVEACSARDQWRKDHLRVKELERRCDCTPVWTGPLGYACTICGGHR